MIDIAEAHAMVRAALAALGVTEPDQLENGYGGRAGSSRLAIFLHPQPQQDRTLVQVRAEIARDVPLSPELYEYVACNASNYLFGSLGVFPGEGGVGLIIMTHSLVAEHCSSELLVIIITAIAATADRLDDEVVARFGGLVCFAQ